MTFWPLVTVCIFGMTKVTTNMLEHLRQEFFNRFSIENLGPVEPIVAHQRCCFFKGDYENKLDLYIIH